MTNSHIKKILGSCVEVEGLGVIFRGASGSGKSDLALRLIDSGANLIADDVTELTVEKGALVARAPKTIRHLLEVRGIGVLKIGGASQAELGVVIDLVTPKEVDRRPEEQSLAILGRHVPLFRICPFEASSPAKVRLIVRQLKGDIANVP